MPDRVAAVGVIGGVAPFWPDALQGVLPMTKHAFRLARWAPGLLVFLAGRVRSSADRFLAKLRSELPDSDRQILDRPDVARVLAENYAESVVSDEMGLR